MDNNQTPKTNTDVNVPLLDIPKMILEKYKGKLPDGKVLPIISNQNLMRI